MSIDTRVTEDVKVVVVPVSFGSQKRRVSTVTGPKGCFMHVERT